MALYNVHKSSVNVDETRKQQCQFYGNQWYTSLHSHKDYVWRLCPSLPTPAILVLGLLEKKEGRTKKKKDDEQFCVGSNNFLGRYWALHKHVLAVLKVATNADTTLENAYAIKSAWKYTCMRQRRKSGVFVETASETPYCMIRYVFSRSWHCCKLSMQALIIHTQL